MTTPVRGVPAVPLEPAEPDDTSSGRYWWAPAGAEATDADDKRRLPLARELLVLLVVGVLAGILIGVAVLVWATHRPATAQASCSTYASQCAPHVVDDLVAAAGDTQLIVLDLYPDRAEAQAPSSPGARTIYGYVWRDGDAQLDRTVPGTIEDGMLFDVTAVDWTVVDTLVAQAPNLTGISNGNVAVRLLGSTSGPVTIQVHVTDQTHSTVITADATGQVVTVDP